MDTTAARHNPEGSTMKRTIATIILAALTTSAFAGPGWIIIRPDSAIWSWFTDHPVKFER